MFTKYPHLLQGACQNNPVCNPVSETETEEHGARQLCHIYNVTQLAEIHWDEQLFPVNTDVPVHQA